MLWWGIGSIWAEVYHQLFENVCQMIAHTRAQLLVWTYVKSSNCLGDMIYQSFSKQISLNIWVQEEINGWQVACQFRFCLLDSILYFLTCMLYFESVRWWTQIIYHLQSICQLYRLFYNFDLESGKLGLLAVPAQNATELISYLWNLFSKSS